MADTGNADKNAQQTVDKRIFPELGAYAVMAGVKTKTNNKEPKDPYTEVERVIRENSGYLRPKCTKPVRLDSRNIELPALALVHMTSYKPECGIILSRRDKLGGSRNSVHFTLNRAVKSHSCGNWDDRKYAIIMPFESAIKQNEKGKFIEGMPDDLYTNGSVKIPEGSVIIKLNQDLS